MLETIKLNHLRILVAEGNQWDRRQINSMLRAFGAVDVLNTRDGAKTLETVETQVPDVIIISGGLSLLSGPEVVRLIRHHKSKSINHLPIVFIANVVRRGEMQMIARLGVHEVVCKPFSTKSLIDRIYWSKIVPRPFVRTKTYFGPQPRTRFWEEALGLESSDQLNYVADGLHTNEPEPEAAMQGDNGVDIVEL